MMPTGLEPSSAPSQNELDVLADRLSQKTQKLKELLGGAAPAGAAPAPEATMAPDLPMAEAPMAPMAPPTADAQLVEQASAKMVEAGMIDRITGVLTPDIMELLSLAVEAAFPGLLNLSDPSDLEEALKGVINGTIALIPRGKLADAARSAAAAPVGPAPGGVPAPGAGDLGAGGLGAPGGVPTA